MVRNGAGSFLARTLWSLLPALRIAVERLGRRHFAGALGHKKRRLRPAS